jgi:hypothetical protein
MIALPLRADSRVVHVAIKAAAVDNEAERRKGEMKGASFDGKKLFVLRCGLNRFYQSFGGVAF